MGGIIPKASLDTKALRGQGLRARCPGRKGIDAFIGRLPGAFAASPRERAKRRGGRRGAAGRGGHPRREGAFDGPPGPCTAGRGAKRRRAGPLGAATRPRDGGAGGARGGRASGGMDAAGWHRALQAGAFRLRSPKRLERTPRRVGGPYRRVGGPHHRGGGPQRRGLSARIIRGLSRPRRRGLCRPRAGPVARASLGASLRGRAATALLPHRHVLEGCRLAPVVPRGR